MTSRYTRHGCAIRSEGDPYAVCVDEIAAMQVFNALVEMEAAVNRREALRAPRDRGYVPGAKPNPAPLDVDEAYARITRRYPKILARLGEGPQCTTRRENDEYACSCGKRWGVDEDDPHNNASASS